MDLNFFENYIFCQIFNINLNKNIMNFFNLKIFLEYFFKIISRLF